MKNIQSILAIIIIFSSTSMFVSSQEPEETIISPIVINELMPNPLGVDTDYEWIELYNNSEEVINLSDWKLDGIVLSNFTINPNQYVVVAKNKTKLLELYPDLQNVIQSSFTLNNTTDTVVLESIDYSDTVYYSSIVENVSIERINHCSTDTSTNINNSNTIEVENSVFDEAYCEETIAELSILDSNNNIINSAFVDELLTINLQTSIPSEEIKSIEYLTNNSPTNANLTFISPGNYEIIVKIILIDGEEITLNSSIQIYPRIKINEIMVNPAGSDSGSEWVELFNEQGYELNGWVIRGNNGSDVIKVNSDKYFIHNTSFSITNTTDLIQLLTPDGLISDEINFSDAPENMSLARTNDGVGEFGFTSQITKGSTNTIEIKYENILDIKKYLEGELVNTSGSITVDINVLGDKIIYIQDNTAGIKVKISDTSFNDFEINGSIQITSGILKESYGEKYIEINNNSKIFSLGNNIIVSKNIKVLEELLIGSLISIEGEIIRSSGTSFFVGNEENEYKISIIKSTNITGIKKSNGDSAKITGILSQYGFSDSGEIVYRILPRSINDIEITPKPEETKVTSTKSTSTRPKTTKNTVSINSKTTSTRPRLEISDSVKTNVINDNEQISSLNDSGNTNKSSGVIMIPFSGISLYSAYQFLMRVNFLKFINL